VGILDASGYEICQNIFETNTIPFKSLGWVKFVFERMPTKTKKIGKQCYYELK